MCASGNADFDGAGGFLAALFGLGVALGDVVDLSTPIVLLMLDKRGGSAGTTNTESMGLLPVEVLGLGAAAARRKALWSSRQVETYVKGSIDKGVSKKTRNRQVHFQIRQKLTHR